MIYFEVKLPDIPGSLIELIKPISQNGGNIHGILHHHDKKINNTIPVDIWFELSEELIEISLENIKKDLIKNNIQLVKISVDSKNKIVTFILTGHVFVRYN